MSIIQYSWDLVRLAFKRAWAITMSVITILTIAGGVIASKYPPWESAINNLLWMIPLAFLVLLLIVKLPRAAYEMHKDQQQTINGLQDSLAQKQSRDTDVRINIKQELRTLLESISPEVLQSIDTGQKEIPVQLGITTQVKLSELLKHPDCDNYLSFKKGGGTTMGGAGRSGFITEPGESLTCCCWLYPKDAIIK